MDKTAINCHGCGRFGGKGRRTWIDEHNIIRMICDYCWENWLTQKGRDVLMSPKWQRVPVPKEEAKTPREDRIKVTRTLVMYGTKEWIVETLNSSILKPGSTFVTDNGYITESNRLISD
jgi:hypothetical protein